MHEHRGFLSIDDMIIQFLVFVAMVLIENVELSHRSEYACIRICREGLGGTMKWWVNNKNKKVEVMI
ncbi:hypothetical protein [Salipaludibacillus neizhouensis]|uniref:hypothetical protein n=1 Tax=Salipaludibacillus neizhouensis TaxID=885475 RepID=UPI0011C35C6F|nr:hypothetical protein [Salipaludibacillus neizhouensis]